MRYLIVLFFFSFAAFSNNPPLLSQSGKKKLTDNLAILEKNLKEVENNLANCKSNAVIVETELKDLAELEREHIALKNKYSGQLAQLEKDLEKNSKALSTLSEFEAKVSTTDTKVEGEGRQKGDLQKAQKEIAERQKWQTDAKFKSSKIENLLKAISQNLESIESRKNPLKTQHNQWLAKEKEYEKLFTELSNKKTETEKLLNPSN